MSREVPAKIRIPREYTYGWLPGTAEPGALRGATVARGAWGVPGSSVPVRFDASAVPRRQVTHAVYVIQASGQTLVLRTLRKPWCPRFSRARVE
jgi:hypothetical protein